MKKNATSQELTQSLQSKGFRVRYNYERYPQAYLSSDVRVLVTGPFGKLIKPDQVKVIGRQLVPLSTLVGLEVNIYENGGRVTATIIDKDNNEVGRGVSECSVEDFFYKEVGRRIALGRAIKAQKDGVAEVGPKRLDAPAAVPTVALGAESQEA